MVLRALLLAGLLASVASTPVAAQAAESPASSACSDIPDDAARLACYDRAFGAPERAGWALWREAPGLDGRRGLAAALPAEAPVADRFGRLVRARLYLACREGGLAVWVHFGGAYFDDRGGGTVTYRLGAAPATTRSFQVANDRRSLGFWSDRAARLFLAELAEAVGPGDPGGAVRMALRARPFRTQEVTAVFDLSGLAAPLGRVRHACGG